MTPVQVLDASPDRSGGYKVDVGRGQRVGQLAALVGAPAAYLRQLSAPPVGINQQYGLTIHRAEQVKTL
jgi:hypothetical protein